MLLHLSSNDSVVFIYLFICSKFSTRHTASTRTHWHFTFTLCCHSNEICAPIANPPNSSQLWGTPTIPPSYIWVHAVVWACGRGWTHRQIHTHTHTDARDQYTFRVAYDLCGM